MVDPFLGIQAKYEPLIQERIAQIPLGITPTAYNLTDEEP